MSEAEWPRYGRPSLAAEMSRSLQQMWRNVTDICWAMPPAFKQMADPRHWRMTSTAAFVLLDLVCVVASVLLWWMQ